MLIDIGANLTHDSFDRDRDAVLQRARGRALIGVLGQTGRMQLVLGLLWLLGGAILALFLTGLARGDHELIAAGLMLFIITLIVNMIARWIVSRHKEFSGAN